MVTYKEYKKAMDKKARKKATGQTVKATARTGGKILARTTKVASKSIKGASKAYRARPQLSKRLLSIGTQAYGGAQQKGQRPVGRPKGEYKHRDPQTGQPIPATVYYKRLKTLRRQAQQQAQQKDIQQIQQLAKRGIPPEQAQQIVDARQLQSVGVQPVQQQVQQQMSPEMQRQIMLQRMQQQPQQMSQEMQQQLLMQQRMQQPQQSNVARPIWRRQNEIRYERDAFGNVKVVQGGNNPKNFWN